MLSLSFPASRNTFTVDDARTPVCLLPRTIAVPMNRASLPDLASKIERYISLNSEFIFNYVEPGENQSVYYQEHHILYKSNLILYDNRSSIIRVAVEIFARKSTQEYLVEIRRLQGAAAIYRPFYQSLTRFLLDLSPDAEPPNIASEYAYAADQTHPPVYSRREHTDNPANDDSL